MVLSAAGECVRPRISLRLNDRCGRSCRAKRSPTPTRGRIAHPIAASVELCRTASDAPNASSTSSARRCGRARAPRRADGRRSSDEWPGRAHRPSHPARAGPVLRLLRAIALFTATRRAWLVVVAREADLPQNVGLWLVNGLPTFGRAALGACGPGRSAVTGHSDRAGDGRGDPDRHPARRAVVAAALPRPLPRRSQSRPPGVTAVSRQPVSR